ncbi:hypothetical protein Cus16_0379 [Curtobacterium sp. ER1/6]|nr:hypothetical protein Cus16_0379 [Curtobacterium sp. ER1/6]
MVRPTTPDDQRHADPEGDAVGERDPAAHRAGAGGTDVGVVRHGGAFRGCPRA